MSTTTKKQVLAVSQNTSYYNRYILYVFIICYFSFPRMLLAIESKIQTPVTQYQQAKQELNKLCADVKKRTLREPWIKLSDTFSNIYKITPEWINRPFAMYYSALALEYLAMYSASTSDAKKALERYEILVKQYPKRTITEDALLHMAKIYEEQIKNSNRAQELLKRLIQQYPNSKQTPQAKAYLEKIISSKKKDNPKIENSKKKEQEHTSIQKKEQNKSSSTQKKLYLNKIHWEQQNHIIKIICTFNEPVQWKILSEAANTKKNLSPRLTLEIPNAIPKPDIKPGVSPKKGDLKKLRVDVSTPGNIKILLDISALKTFKVEIKKNPFQIIVYASTLATGLNKSLKVGQSAQSKKTVSNEIHPILKKNHNLAQQLGLRVKTILIDPGHGGKDVGAVYNGIVESEAALDVAKQVGDILSRQGLRIHYTRTNNTWITLGARTRKANELKVDLMISIHINASENNQAHGFETYYLDFARSTESMKLACVENATSDHKLGDLERFLADVLLGARTQESRKLAETIQKNALVHLLQKNYKAHDGGIRSAPFHVLMGSRMPGVLIEVGYCSNKTEAQRLSSNKYRSALAEGIAKGILIYAGELHQRP